MIAHPKLQQFLNSPIGSLLGDAATGSPFEGPSFGGTTDAARVVSTRETPMPGVEVTTHFPEPVGYTKSGKARPRFPSESVTVTFEIRHSDAPALVAAIEEIRNEIGERLSAPHKFSKEDALTRAAAALSSLHAGVTAAGYTQADPEYR